MAIADNKDSMVYWVKGIKIWVRLISYPAIGCIYDTACVWMYVLVISRNSNGKRRLCNCGLRLVYTEVFDEVNKGRALDFDFDGLLSRVEAVL